jgi:hypothetical protein
VTNRHFPVAVRSQSEQATDEPSGPEEASRATSQCVDWFHEGETKVVEVAGVRITVRFVGRRGRRARIAIAAPPGAVYSASGSGPS